MAYDTFTGYAQVNFNYAAGKNGPSTSLSAPQTANSNTISLKNSWVIGGAIAGGINETTYQIQSIAASSNATINLQSLTDVLNATGIVLVRVKYCLVALLSATQDTVNGTACSSITVGNAGANPNLLFLSSATPTFNLNNASHLQWSDGTAAGVTVSGTALNVKFLNNDGANAAAILTCFAGSTT